MIKRSKIRYSWEFLLKGKRFLIDLYVSRVSGKRRIFVNKELFADEKRESLTIAEFYLRIGGNSITIKENRENLFELIVNGLSFEDEVKRRQERGENIPDILFDGEEYGLN